MFLPGVAYGAQLALARAGFVTLVFGILRFSNFAHGDLMAFGTMLTILVTWWLQSMGISFGPMPTALLALPIGILGAVALSLATDRMVLPLLSGQTFGDDRPRHGLGRRDVHLQRQSCA